MTTISFRPEYVLRIAGFDISNTLLTAVLASVVLLAFASMIRAYRGRRPWFFAEIVIEGILGAMDIVTGDRRQTKRLFPFIATLLLFILVGNWLGLIPGFLGSITLTQRGLSKTLLKAPTADLNTTLSLALLSLAVVEYVSIRSLGIGGFFRRFFNFTNVPLFIAGMFELLSEVIRLFSLAVRLFGNIFAGEVLIGIASLLVPFILPVGFYLLEFFIGLIQAGIFAVLSLAYTKVAAQPQRA